ncbi:hypothetical protein HT102_00380 [Hoyosella sp. G463]|uniref:DUF7847 domain-containing protein n=1 Tax=Lolliginicoccus lacisalsi TaxID=2742202 RepID=A0A927J994_9ACTN|nr:hypothetical protein [Lolliginicoccus lacisalsi]MBD8504943.1 hypothetical protein [Lolliginicoccus lacisalsi]
MTDPSGHDPTGYRPPPPGYQPPPPGGTPGPQGNHGMPPMQPVDPARSGAPRPGVIPLRPLGVGEILDGAVKTMTRYAVVMFGLTAILVTIGQVVATVAQLPTADIVLDPTTVDAGTEGMAGWVAGQLIAAVISGLVTIVLLGMLTTVVKSAVLGAGITIGETWTAARPHLLRILGLYLLGVVAGITLIGLVVGGFIAHWAIGLVALLVGLALVVWVGVLVSVSVPALVFEKTGVITAIRRSIELVRGTWWRVLGVLLLLMLIAFGISLIFLIPFGILGGIAGAVVDSTIPVLIVSAIGGILMSIVITPFSTAATSLLYVDLRMRKEGLDIELARASGVQPTP